LFVFGFFQTVRQRRRNPRPKKQPHPRTKPALKQNPPTPARLYIKLVEVVYTQKLPLQLRGLVTNYL